MADYANVIFIEAEDAVSGPFRTLKALRDVADLTMVRTSCVLSRRLREVPFEIGRHQAFNFRVSLLRVGFEKIDFGRRQESPHVWGGSALPTWSGWPECWLPDKSSHGPRALALPVTSATALAIRLRVVADGRLESASVGADGGYGRANVLTSPA